MPPPPPQPSETMASSGKIFGCVKFEVLTAIFREVIMRSLIDTLSVSEDSKEGSSFIFGVKQPRVEMLLYETWVTCG